MTQPFLGEMMTCVMCNRRERSDPNLNSQSRAVTIGGQRYYACPKEFPPDETATPAQYAEAYKKVLHRAKRWRKK